MDKIVFINTGYEVITAAISAAILAQILKVLLYVLVNKKFNFKIITTTGGMPSSHSAGVCALAMSVCLISGFDSVSFAIASGYAVVVMYDAAGVRRAAGKTAATLNRLVRDLSEQNKEPNPYEVLKELLGHIPKEVVCGAILGIAVAISVHALLSL